MSGDEKSIQHRQRAIRLLAAATPEELHWACAAFASANDAVDLKPTETGLVMVRGQISGDGAPFNIGEATVAKAIVQLPDGTVGCGLRLGRDRASARCAAIIDALWQTPALRNAIDEGVLQPIEGRLAAVRSRKQGEVAATRVNFFTMAREAT